MMANQAQISSERRRELSWDNSFSSSASIISSCFTSSLSSLVQVAVDCLETFCEAVLERVATGLFLRERYSRFVRSKQAEDHEVKAGFRYLFVLLLNSVAV